jgi:hypothetical protein
MLISGGFLFVSVVKGNRGLKRPGRTNLFFSKPYTRAIDRWPGAVEFCLHDNLFGESANKKARSNIAAGLGSNEISFSNKC